VADFVSIPPSKKRAAPEGFFQGGLMPATAQDITALIILDVRSLRLSSAQGRELEKSVREHVFKQLGAMKVNIQDRSAIDLSTAVFGLAIE
jgi:hypothetical protein